MNWRGCPLVSHEVVVGLIGSTTTTRGLRVRSELDEHQPGIFAAISFRRIPEFPVFSRHGKVLFAESLQQKRIYCYNMFFFVIIL